MDPTAAVLAGRRAAENLMVDTVAVSRRSSEPVTDPETGKVTFPEVTIYEGKGRIQVNAPSENTVDTAGASFTVQTMSLHVPVSAGPFRVGDLVEIRASPLDPHRVGHTMSIAGLHEKTLATAQRLKIKQTTG